MFRFSKNGSKFQSVGCTSNFEACSTLTIAAIKTLSPKASEISTKSPLLCEQAAHEKKLRIKMPMNSARMDRHKLFDLVSLTPKVYLKAIAGAGECNN